ncbi:MAG TPA: universal stress protein [Smithellaceae bacterium]|nr:universal stress protein [Smithellaceae bacterium]
MYRKVLVPLDGSAVAECSLPHIVKLVKDGAVGEVTLLNVIWADVAYVIGVDPDIGSHRQKIMNNVMERLTGNARKYLGDIKMRLAADGVKVKTKILEGIRPADTISDYVQKNGIDLVIIATHGYTGLKKMMLGSVALDILHNACAPVLLIKPGAGGAEKTAAGKA